jgi:hypothetical protein
MYVIENVSDDYAGCTDEQNFKKLYCVCRIRGGAEHRVKGSVIQKIFCIETEETVAGFPDVMELITGRESTVARFYEFKISDSKGNIKFQSTQPSFYRDNSELNIRVIAYNRESRRVHRFSPDEIFKRDSPYFTVTGRINLSAVEKEVGV